MTTCRSCNAPIEWAVSEANSKRIPFDVEPIEAGTFLLRETEQGAPSAHFVAAEERQRLEHQAKLRGDTLRLFVSHFATCPQADGWRK